MRKVAVPPGDSIYALCKFRVAQLGRRVEYLERRLISHSARGVRAHFRILFPLSLALATPFRGKKPLLFARDMIAQWDRKTANYRVAVITLLRTLNYRARASVHSARGLKY